MHASRRIAVLIVLMTTIVVAVGGSSIWILYRAAMKEQRARLLEIAATEALAIERIVDEQGPAPGHGGALDGDTLARIDAVLAERPEFARAGELAVGRRTADGIAAIVFAPGRTAPRPHALAADAAPAAPMVRALAGEQGTVVSRADDGSEVLAAFVPIPSRAIGVVARLDLADIRAPFARAASIALVLGIVLVACGTTAFLGISEPMIQHVRASEQRFRELFDNMRSAVIVFRPGSGDRPVVSDLNRTAEAVETLAREDALGRASDEIFAGESFVPVRKALDGVIAGHDAVQLPAIFHDDRRTPSWREYLIHPLPGGEVVVMIDDVTERKTTEEQLHQAQKMEVIGQLTGGLAHDFNNLLGIIIGNLELLQEQPGPGMPAEELLRDALWSARRGSELVDRLLAFARRQPLRPEAVDLDRMLRGMTGFLARTVGPLCEVRLEFDGGLWPILADRGRLETALVNLVVNARDAMPDGGTLTLSARNCEPGDCRIETGNASYVELAIQDTGIGMAEAVKARVFEPFFTTKQPGKGSGLGLSMVYGFIAQSGGHIDIASAPGHGTSVRLLLPKAELAPG